MMEWFVVWFFVKSFGKGMVIGGIIRFLIALLFRGDFSWKGWLRSMIIGGIIYTCIVYYLLMNVRMM